jgi:hypothetical protein
MRRYRRVCVCRVGWSARNDGGHAYFHIVTAGPTSVQVCAPFVSFPLPTHSEIEHVANTTHTAMIITLRDDILAHERDPGYDGFQQLKWVDVVVREGSVRHRHSFFSHRFLISSTTFLPILHSTLTCSYSSPLFSDRCNPPFQAKPV